MKIQDLRKKPKESIDRALMHFSTRQGRTIVEIGSMRNPLEHPLENTDLPCCHDGHSSVLLARGAEDFYTIDIDPQCSKITRDSLNAFSLDAQVLTGDGISFLETFNKPIDLLYLDAWDVGTPEFAEKNLQAYAVARKNLHENSLILINDTDIDFSNEVFIFRESGYSGKGKLLIPEAAKDGFRVIFSGRQTLLMKRKPMDISFSGIARLVSFLEKIERDTYPEYPSPIHQEITKKQLNALLDKFPMEKDARILDVGCGQGPALALFRERGYQPTGITINDEDLDACQEAGFNVLKMDQSFLDFTDGTFQLIWARHVIEHSIFPYFTLCEFHRVMQKGGLLYLEVPALETSGQHESNGNHYSVLSVKMWGSLIARAGFEPLEHTWMKFETGIGPDEYWAFTARKP